MQFCSENEKNHNKKNSQQDQKAGLQIAKKKPSLLKRKKLPATKIFSNINLKHVVNIGDICYVNQEALRNPQESEQTLLKTIFNYKMISRVTINTFFVNVELKKSAQNLLPPEYFCERLRSFGDKQAALIADHLQKIANQFSIIRASPIEQYAIQKSHEVFMLQNFLKTMEGKKFYLYFQTITPERITMKNVVFSVPLLEALGCDMKNLALDFLKYKHIFFEVFTAKNYGNFLQNCFENFSKISKHLIQNPNLSVQERAELVQMYYSDEVIRKIQNTDGMQEQILKAKVRWFSPHPSICCIEILDIKEAGVIKPIKKIKTNFQEGRPKEQLQTLRRTGISHSLLVLENNQDKQMTAERSQESLREIAGDSSEKA